MTRTTSNPRNYGLGRRMDYAGRQALADRYGGGHFATVAAHSDRWSSFCQWARGEGLRDMRDVRPEHAAAYAAAMKEQGLAVSTQQNRLSTINVVLTHASRGRWAPVSPRELVGISRSQVRTAAPTSLDRSIYSSALAGLHAAHLDRAAAVLAMAREFGMRSEEATKSDLDRLAREARASGQINIIDGTKGGRDAPRWVAVTESGRAALDAAIAARPAGSRNLMAPSERYCDWRAGELRDGREVLHAYGIKGYHDARAGYACERYSTLTGCAAPCVSAERTASRDADRAAREVIAVELGHGRSDVTRAYLGSAR